ADRPHNRRSRSVRPRRDPEHHRLHVPDRPVRYQISAADASDAALRICLEVHLVLRVWTAAVAVGPEASHVRGGLPGDPVRRDPDAAGDSVGLCLAELCEGAGGSLAVNEVSLARLYVIRLTALLAIYGLFSTVVTLVDHAPSDRGVHKALISGLWLMALFALRYPLKMVPVLLFELIWKTVWLLAFGLPQWWSGTGSPQLR